MTKTEVQALARKRWGPKAYVEESRRSPTKAVREAAQAKRRGMIARRTEIAEELKGLEGWKSPLLKAARFVVDVNGGPPSMDELRAALERAERHHDLTTESAALHRDMQQLPWLGHHWRVCENNGMFCHIVAEGDTLDELAERCQPKQTVAA